MKLISNWIKRKPRFPEVPLAPVVSTEIVGLRAQLDQTLIAKAKLERELSGRPKHQAGARILGDKFSVVLPFASRDMSQAWSLIQWWKELEDEEKRLPDLVFVVPLAVPDSVISLMQSLAESQGWDHVHVVRPAFDLPDERWPIGSCWSFLHAAEWCARNRSDFFWCEPDCIALKPDWVSALRDAYVAGARPFMGYLEPECPRGTYPAHMAGCGVYTWETARIYNAARMGEAFDISLAPLVYPRAQATPLIHQDFGRPDPPEFVTMSDLERIPSQAVVFHRNKDGRLIELLRQRRLK